MTFANFEQAGLNFLTLAILPWVVRFERKQTALNRAAPRRPFLKINTSAIVRADIERQTRALALGRQWGWFSANDCRRLLDLEPIGSEGDVYLTPLNMQSTNDEPQNAVSLEDARRAVALRAV